MFPYQLGMLGLCSIVYMGSRFMDGGQSLLGQAPGPLLSKLFKAILLLSALWALVLLPIIPHFWIYRADIFGYILGVAFESDFYKLGEQQGPQWSFHWLGYSGVWHLGGLNVIMAELIGAGVFCSLLPVLRKFAPDTRWISLVFLALGAFGGIAVNSVHQPWFGMTFQLLLLAAALSFLASVANNPHLAPWVFPVFVFALWIMRWQAVLNRWFLISSVLICGLLLFGALFFRWDLKRSLALACSAAFAMLCWKITQVAPYHNYVERTIQEEGEKGLEWRRTGAERVLKVLTANWKSESTPVIWCANYGWVDGNTISWEAAKAGHPWKIYNLGTIFGGQQKGSSGLGLPEYADYIVVPSPGITGEIVTPSGISDWNSIVRARANWELLDEVKAPKGAVFVYRNQVPVEYRNFSGATEWIKFCAEGEK